MLIVLHTPDKRYYSFLSCSIRTPGFRKGEERGGGERAHRSIDDRRDPEHGVGGFASEIADRDTPIGLQFCFPVLGDLILQYEGKTKREESGRTLPVERERKWMGELMVLVCY